MKTKTFLVASIALSAIIMFVFSGCSSDSGGKNNSPSPADRAGDELIDSTFAPIGSASAYADYAAVPGAAENAASEITPMFNDMVLRGDILYVAVENGVLVYNMIDGGTSLIPAKAPITALIDLGDKILAGGDNLYELDSFRLCDDQYQLDLPGPITVLHHHTMNLLIGTTGGLYILDANGIRELAGNLHVSAMTSDLDGVWIGTAGEGLYHWNGDSFRKRYLQRDSTLFDNVTALDYNHNHLYLGTDKGMFVYDGGRWQPYGLADGLPSELITAINADEWAVKVGTANGPVTFFDNGFKLMQKLEGMVITRFIKNDRKLVAATTNAGLVMKSGGLVTVLFDGDIKATQIALEEKQ